MSTGIVLSFIGGWVSCKAWRVLWRVGRRRHGWRSAIRAEVAPKDDVPREPKRTTLVDIG